MLLSSAICGSECGVLADLRFGDTMTVAKFRDGGKGSLDDVCVLDSKVKCRYPFDSNFVVLFNEAKNQPVDEESVVIVLYVSEESVN
jgi:hypothetical protein